MVPQHLAAGKAATDAATISAAATDLARHRSSLHRKRDLIR
jgi:hypothetical protein